MRDLSVRNRDFAPIVRAVAAANPDLVVICSYPPDSVGMVRAVSELGFKPKAIGGAMVGLQATSIKAQAWTVAQWFQQLRAVATGAENAIPGMADLISQLISSLSPLCVDDAYQERAAAEGVDPSGCYMAPWAYAQLQVLQQAVEATKALDDAELADYIRAHAFTTVVGEIKFGSKGEWAQSRGLQLQYQNIKGHEIAQFKDMSTRVVVEPSEYASGEVIYPYERAK